MDVCLLKREMIDPISRFGACISLSISGFAQGRDHLHLAKKHLQQILTSPFTLSISSGLTLSKVYVRICQDGLLPRSAFSVQGRTLDSLILERS
jgi:hypothetical protein